MRIVIVGCGRAGAELALRMYRRGHEVTVVDQASSAFSNLHPDFRGRTIQGDVLAEQLLKAAGIEKADIKTCRFVLNIYRLQSSCCKAFATHMPASLSKVLHFLG